MWVSWLIAISICESTRMARHETACCEIFEAFGLRDRAGKRNCLNPARCMNIFPLALEKNLPERLTKECLRLINPLERLDV